MAFTIYRHCDIAQLMLASTARQLAHLPDWRTRIERVWLDTLGRALTADERNLINA